MSKAKPYVFGAAMGASAMFFALQYHVVHSHDGFQILPRTPQQSIGLAYSDIRGWSPSQWTDRPELARALMAHGSSDLIAESVSSTLADTVAKDTSTLDELRSFLNNTAKSGATERSSGLPNAPRFDGSNSSDSGKSLKESDNDLFKIPFPQDARTKPPADPFRVAKTDGPVSDAVPQTQGKSRFSANDVLEGLSDHDEELPGKLPIDPVPTESSASKPSSTATTKPSRSIAQQAQDMEDRIFGKNSETNPPAVAKPAKKSTLKPLVNDSMFDEVTTQLENRAQDALNRAKETVAERASSAASESAKSATNFVREKVTEALPEAAKSLGTGAASDAGKAATSTSQEFDPFLE